MRRYENNSNDINVIIYCRVSTDEQRQGTSVDVQEERLKAYCTFKGYNIITSPEFRDCKEDESAKTFEKRPIMQAILNYIRRHRGKVQKLLFLRWNRFSRDLFSATDAVKELLDLGVEPNAIEEELNFESTSWPVLLGAYIGIAQSDNIARSKATIDGIRGTLKKGKCSNRAPRGYKNIRESKHNCYVVILEDVAKPIRKAFKELAKGVLSANYIRKKYCPHIPESTFFGMMRNPFYMGKIRVPAYKDEPEILVEGQHEALISEDVFNMVQDVLDGRKNTKTKLTKHINPDLFLRKFLICPVCGRGFTGATSKGNGGYYTYYYCSEDTSHILIRADAANEIFIQYVSQLKPHPTVSKLYGMVLGEIHRDMRKELQIQIEHVKRELIEKNRQIAHVEDLMVSDREHISRYSKIIERYEEEAHLLQMKLKILATQNRKDIKPKLRYVISLINNMDKHMRDAPIEVKFKLIGLMFPEKIVFDGKLPRTKRLNIILEYMCHENNGLDEHMPKKKEAEKSTSLVSTPNDVDLELILNEIDRWYEMKLWIPDPTKTILPKSLKERNTI